MNHSPSLNLGVAAILRSIGNQDGLAAAVNLESTGAYRGELHLRHLGLTASDVVRIARLFAKGQPEKETPLRSLSFSYNPLLGDEGATALALPSSLSEVGLVNCGIGDRGGAEILKWMGTANHLRMICIEQNNFSEVLKSAFRAFGHHNPGVLVVV